MVGVILDTLQQIETQLLMRQYDGLMECRVAVYREGKQQPQHLFKIVSCFGDLKIIKPRPVPGFVLKQHDSLQNKEEIELMRISSLLVGKTLAQVACYYTPGISTFELDAFAEKFIRDNDGFLL